MRECRAVDGNDAHIVNKDTCTDKAGIPGLQERKRNGRRIIETEGFSPYPKQFGREKLAVPDIGYIIIGEEKINTNAVHDLVSNDQRTAMGFMLRLLETREGAGLFKAAENETVDIYQKVDELYREIDENSIDMVYSGNFPDCGRFLAVPRKVDFMAVVNRMRNLRCRCG